MSKKLITPMLDLKLDLIKSIETSNVALEDIEDLETRKVVKAFVALTISTIVERIDDELLIKESELMQKALDYGLGFGYQAGFTDATNSADYNNPEDTLTGLKIYIEYVSDNYLKEDETTSY